MGLVERLRGLLAAATPGPWEAVCMGSEGYHLVERTASDGTKRRKRVALCTYESWETDKANAALIAEGVSALPALLADNEDKRQESATYKAMAVKAEQEAQRHFDRAAASEADNERLTAENANLRESAETAVFVANANTESLRIWQERYETLSLHHSAEAARADAAEARLTRRQMIAHRVGPWL